MGIKYFFKWFKDSFGKAVTKPFDLNDFNTADTTVVGGATNKPYRCDNGDIMLLLDLNGVIHTSCRKIYKYGPCEPIALLNKRPPVQPSDATNLAVFEDVLHNIDVLVAAINPVEIVICIDGVAPISKQIQQRQRRFVSKNNVGNSRFDSNCISPGTDFLYKLGCHLRVQIEKRLESKWLRVSTIHFMDSMVPGEGEHKLFDFLRSNKHEIESKKYTMIVTGNDADLIMLALLASTLYLENNPIYILRENFTNKKRQEYVMVDVDQTKQCLLEHAANKPDWNSQDANLLVCDFVLLCFMVGNDFLPALPLFNIYDGGLDLTMKHYFTTSGTITFQTYKKRKNNGAVKPSRLQINFKNFMTYVDHILHVVCPNSVQHYQTREYGYCNDLLDKVAASDSGTRFNDIADHYLRSYSTNHKINRTMVKWYLDEIKWVFDYYVYGGTTVDWKMYYPGQFAPTPIDLLKYMEKTNHSGCSKKIKEHYRSDPFFQLLCILPPRSNDLLPEPLKKILCEDMVRFHPERISMDYEGKLNEWEGVPLLPPLNHDEIFALYEESVKFCKKKDLKRNKSTNRVIITAVEF
jgi:5'-3' exonuclease